MNFDDTACLHKIALFPGHSHLQYQAIKNWRREQPGNEATHMLKDSVFGFIPGLRFGTRLRVNYIISELMFHKQQGTWRWQYQRVGRLSM